MACRTSAHSMQPTRQSWWSSSQTPGSLQAMQVMLYERTSRVTRPCRACMGQAVITTPWLNACAVSSVILARSASIDEGGETTSSIDVTTAAVARWTVVELEGSGARSGDVPKVRLHRREERGGVTHPGESPGASVIEPIPSFLRFPVRIWHLFFIVPLFIAARPDRNLSCSERTAAESSPPAVSRDKSNLAPLPISCTTLRLMLGGMATTAKRAPTDEESIKKESSCAGDVRARAAVTHTMLPCDSPAIPAFMPLVFG